MTDALKRILIFDDDEDQRKLLLTYLGKMFEGVQLEQYDPLELGAPPENFDWSRYDVLILDYYLCLHGVTGMDIVHANRNNPAFPPTIMLTGAGNEEIAMRALKAGIHDYLRKQSLDKQELRNSILNAFEKHKQAKKLRGGLTEQGAAFSKALFYQKLEYKKDDHGFRDRTLLLIELNDPAGVEERAGVILRDNIVRHIARQSYEVFKLGECNPTAIRIGDYSIALLIDAPESRKTLEFNINGLINHLKKRPYKFADSKFRVTVSIGVVALPGLGQSADTILQYAKSACKIAAAAEDNAYHIYEESGNTDLQHLKPAATAPMPDLTVEESEVPDLTIEPETEPAPNARVTTPQSEEKTPAITRAAPAVPVAQPKVTVTKPAVPELIRKPEAGPVTARVTATSPDLKILPEVKAVPAVSGMDNDLIHVPTAQPKQQDNKQDEPELHLELEPVPEAPAKPATLASQIARVTPEVKPIIKPEVAAQMPVPASVPKPVQVKAEVKPVSKPAAPAPTTNNRPQKTLAELKADAARPKPVVTKESAPVAPKPQDPELDISPLDEAGRNLKMAFDEKRVIQLFQPVISLMSEEVASEGEIHRVSLQLIDKDGTVKTAADIKSRITLPAFRKFVDRWLLREIIGRLTNTSKNQHTFIMDISDASLADANFFNWLRKLLTGLDSVNSGKFIVMEIDTKHLGSLEKQANALITYLRKTHNFKFLLGNIDTVEEVVQFASRIKFDLIRCNHKLIHELRELVPADKTRGNSQLELLKSTGIRFIADNIGDATTLTEIISLNTEYAMGDLIGEPSTQLDDVTNVETFEII